MRPIYMPVKLKLSFSVELQVNVEFDVTDIFA